jgi:hypothetical protein
MRAGAITIQKQKLNCRTTLSKGGAQYAIVGLPRIRLKRIQEAGHKLGIASKKLNTARNKADIVFVPRPPRGLLPRTLHIAHRRTLYMDFDLALAIT